MAAKLEIDIASRDRVYTKLTKEIERIGSQGAFARQNGIDQSQLSLVVSGRIDPPPVVLKAIGYKRKVIYYAERN
jgi:hypothetical protein